MIDRSRPNPFFRRRTWVVAAWLSLALAAAGLLVAAGIYLKNLVRPGVDYPPPEYLLLVALPLGVVLAGAAAVLGAVTVVRLAGSGFRHAFLKIAYCCPGCR